LLANLSLKKTVSIADVLNILAFELAF